MKTHKLFVIAAIVCLLVGASGAAMAEPGNCELGFIANETVDDIIITEPQNCYISNVLVLGDVRIQNGGEVIMRKTKVFGSVRIVDSTDVGLFENEIVDGDVVVRRPRVAYIVDNRLIRSGPQRQLVLSGVGVNNINEETSEREGEGLVFDNIVEEGFIRCRNNDGLVFARSNIALSVQCLGQIQE